MDRSSSTSAADLLARYQRWRRVAEPAFWIVLLGVIANMNAWIDWIDATRGGGHIADWKPLTWEYTSNLLVLTLVPAIVAFERRVPLRFATAARNLPWHLAGSVVFSIIHVGGMIALRKLVYALHQQHYVFATDWLPYSYEYFKDIRTYFELIATIGLYRLILWRLQGEASLLDAPEQGPPVEPVERPERFLVRKLGREFLLPAADIEWIQAWGNYVNLHVRGHDYPLRATMATIETRLDPQRFVRVHRSYIANLDFVAEIEPLESGDARALLRDGRHIPVSRRYRDALRRVLGVQGVEA